MGECLLVKTITCSQLETGGNWSRSKVLLLLFQLLLVLALLLLGKNDLHAQLKGIRVLYGL